MSDLNDMYRAAQARDKARDKAEKAAQRWSPFVWAADGRYPASARLSAIPFASRKRAEAVADKMNAAGMHGGNVVVREVTL